MTQVSPQLGCAAGGGPAYLVSAVLKADGKRQVVVANTGAASAAASALLGRGEDTP